MSVIERLKQHILVDGFHVVVDLDKSQGSWVVDKENGKRYLDCYSQFASQALGWNYPQDFTRLQEISKYKICNSDMYSEVYADFVDAFSHITPDFKHYFFVEGGSCGVENALKAAFDWKCQIKPDLQERDGADLDVIHLKEAFHGRTGYTLSLTNTGEMKTKWFPKFKWTRITNPKIRFPLDDAENARLNEVERLALAELNIAMRWDNVAAIIMETIQGEGGDNHFRPSYFQGVRKLCDEHGVMMILDEVQCGMGLTGKWWAYEHMGVKPDMMCFGKKTQVCGFAANERIEQAPQNVFVQSGRINSTWGGNFVDMERSKSTISAIQTNNLVDNAAKVGKYFLNALIELSKNKSEMINVRGRGLMIAFDLPSPERRDEVVSKAHDVGLLSLKCGTQTIRFRPALSFSEDDVGQAISSIVKALS